MGYDNKPNLTDSQFEQCSGNILHLSGCTIIVGQLEINSGGTFTILQNKGAGKVLISDASGVGTWGNIMNGTTNYIPKFNSDGTNIQNSHLSVGQVCFSGVGLFSAIQSNDATNRINFGFCNDVYKGLSFGYNSGSDSGPSISPTYTGALRLQSSGSNPIVLTSGAVKINVDSSANSNILIDGCGTGFNNKYLYYFGGDNYQSDNAGIGVGLIGGDARVGYNKCGGDVLIKPGLKDGTGIDGCVFIQRLPSKTTETCAVYIDATGKLSTGEISGGTGSDTIGWSNSLNGSTIVGCGTVVSGATVCDNTYFGVSAGTSTTTGAQNIAVGSKALKLNIVGIGNTAVGYNALGANNANHNTALGYIALQSNSNGACNVAVGVSSLSGNQTGCDNVGVGYGTLTNNIGGNNNIAMGRLALQANCASANIGIGYQALYLNTMGTQNIGIGCQAMCCTTLGNYNVAIGSVALSRNTTGCENIVIGYRALYSNQTGSQNIAIGNNALNSNIGTSTIGENVAIGTCAMCNGNTAYRNVAIGHQAIGNVVTGAMANTIAIGYKAMYNGCGSSSVGIGSCSLYNSTSGQNTAIGSYTLYCSTTGINNTAVGYSAHMCNIVGSNNIAIGVQALHESTGGTLNIGIGQQTLRVARTGSAYNLGILSGALGCLTTGQYNVGIGVQAGGTVTSTCHNVAIGFQALALSAGACNTVVGTCAGSNSSGITSGNVFLGFQAGSVETGSNMLWIANSSATFLVKGNFSDNTICNGSNSTTWQQSSDIRIKENVSTIPNAIDLITCLNPVVYDYTTGYSTGRSWNESKRICNYGFIAQEYENVFPRCIIMTSEIVDGETISDFRSIDTGHLVPLLVKAIKEQQMQINDLCEKIITLTSNN